jgi:hypothetical protein
LVNPFSFLSTSCSEFMVVCFGSLLVPRYAKPYPPAISFEYL